MSEISVPVLRDEDIVALFFRVARLSRKIPDSGSARLYPFAGQYRCMLLLDESGCIAQSRLADLMQVRPASLSELLYKLEKKGYVHRAPSETDRRSLLVSLTERGAEEVRSYRRIREQAQLEMLCVLSPEEKRQLFCILGKIENYYAKGEHTV